MGAGSSLITVILSVSAFYSRTVSQTQVDQMIKAEVPSILARTVDREEVLRLIKTEAPWLVDRADIVHRVERIEQNPWFSDKASVEHRLQVLESADLVINDQIRELHAKDGRLEGQIIGMERK